MTFPLVPVRALPSVAVNVYVIPAAVLVVNTTVARPVAFVGDVAVANDPPAPVWVSRHYLICRRHRIAARVSELRGDGHRSTRRHARRARGLRGISVAVMTGATVVIVVVPTRDPVVAVITC